MKNKNASNTLALLTAKVKNLKTLFLSKIKENPARILPYFLRIFPL